MVIDIVVAFVYLLEFSVTIQRCRACDCSAQQREASHHESQLVEAKLMFSGPKGWVKEL